MSLWLSGIGVSRGVAIGRVQKLLGGDLDIPEYALEADKVEPEVERFKGAHARAKEQLKLVRDRIPETTPEDIAAFIDTHLLMMDDRSITEATITHIRELKLNAEASLKRTQDSLVAIFEAMDDPYLRTRRDDVEHVIERIQRALMKMDRRLSPVAEEASGPAIIVADDITPADIILLSQQSTAAFITEFGGPLSHTAILARSLGIPAIVGTHSARRLLRDGERLIVDGHTGHVIGDPDDKTVEFFAHRMARDERYRRMLSLLKDEPAISKDGEQIHLQANIELPEDTSEVKNVGADSVGLYRTEFLFMNRTELPNEEEQYKAYSEVVDAVRGSVTIRTLDLGADKQVDSVQRQGPTPNNPALGLRAIRLCLKDTELFKTQIRALLRATAHGKVNIMLPMISNTQEFMQAKRLIEEEARKLRKAGIAIADDVPVGAMIEVPAAAISADLLARHAQFFSIGTNDLIQYTLAIDRVDDEVNYLYDPLHPAVLKLIKLTIDAGAQAGIPVGMCGEMAGDPKFVRLLLGLGLTEFSMHPSSILEVKRIIIDSNIAELRLQAEKTMSASSQSEFQEQLSELLGA